MDEIIARHERIVLQFSGGKDSLACLYLTEKHWDKITVVWINTGDAFPETIEQMATVEQFVPHFLEVKSDQPANIAEHGWPVDILPVSNTIYGKFVEAHSKQIMQGYPACCNENIWQPMGHAVNRLGATLVIRGTRASDTRKVSARNGDVFDGVEYLMPLWDWTGAQVKQFLHSCGVELPKHYAYVDTSLDCQFCTAYLNENAGKMRFLRDVHPDISTEMQRRLKIIAEAVDDEVAHMEKATL